MHKLTIPQIQSKVSLIHRLLPQYEVVAAGGALRDVLTGKPVKDLDFFIGGGGPVEFYEQVYDTLNREFAVGRHAKDNSTVFTPRPVGDDQGTGVGYGSAGTQYDGDFWTVEYERGWYGYPVQLVFLPEKWHWVQTGVLGENTEYISEGVNVRKEVFTKFDFALARVWADERRVRWSPEFASDLSSRRLTLYDSGWGKTTTERVARIRAKFSDYRFVNRSSTPHATPPEG